MPAKCTVCRSWRFRSSWADLTWTTFIQGFALTLIRTLFTISPVLHWWTAKDFLLSSPGDKAGEEYICTHVQHERLLLTLVTVFFAFAVQVLRNVPTYIKCEKLCAHVQCEQLLLALVMGVSSRSWGIIGPAQQIFAPHCGWLLLSLVGYKPYQYQVLLEALGSI